MRESSLQSEGQLSFALRAIGLISSRGSVRRNTPDAVAGDEGIASAIAEEPDTADGVLQPTGLSEEIKPIALLRTWFLSKKRDLPWRSQDGITAPTPYAVWISEIMLQQTQVSVVIPYFLRWMQQFKNIQTLASAPLDAVIKAWEGLGYYSRARNLQKAAQYLVEHHQGKLPSLPQELLKLPGIGPYTASAIRSFAFRQKAAAIDGNVVRVMSRYLGINDTFTTQASLRRLEAEVLALLPDVEPWVVMEALIELGATVCRKKAECYQCPLRAQCHAHLHDQCDLLPLPKKRAVTTCLERDVALVMCEDAILVRRCREGKVMSDLHEFPSHIREEGEIDRMSWLKGLVGSEGIRARPHGLVPVKHSYTRYRVTLYPHVFECEGLKEKEIEGFFWQPLDALHRLAFSAGHRQLAGLLLTRFLTKIKKKNIDLLQKSKF